MTTMKAIAVTEFGKPAQLIERPVPKPGPGEVLLKTVSVGRKPLTPYQPLPSPRFTNNILLCSKPL